MDEAESRSARAGCAGHGIGGNPQGHNRCWSCEAGAKGCYVRSAEKRQERWIERQADAGTSSGCKSYYYSQCHVPMVADIWTSGKACYGDHFMPVHHVYI